MSNTGRPKQVPSKDRKAAQTRRSTNKRRKGKPVEELGPEQRVEFAQQIEAKEFRGKPPSI